MAMCSLLLAVYANIKSNFPNKEGNQLQIWIWMAQIGTCRYAGSCTLLHHLQWLMCFCKHGVDSKCVSFGETIFIAYCHTKNTAPSGDQASPSPHIHVHLPLLIL